MRLKRLSLIEAEFVAHAGAAELMKFDEPIPPFATRYPGRLESCLEQPFAMFADRQLYPGFANKAAALFYLIIKNHPFENGNKRMSVMLCLVFFYKNGRWLNIAPEALYELACLVAVSQAGESQAIIQQISRIFSQMSIVDAAHK